MPPRTYSQYCSLARALDLVGERWTLLLVRDLLGGPRRYGELLEGLPGIGTNLLAARLRELGRLGLVERVRLPEGRGRGYRLTAAGRELEDALVALARFGVRRLGQRGPAELWRPDWTPLALRARFRPGAARGLRESYEFRVDGVVFHARVDDGRLDTDLGPAEDPALVLTLDADAFLALGSGRLSPCAAMESPDVGVEGDLATLERCLALFDPQA